MGRFRNLEKDTYDSVLLRDRSISALRYDAWSDIAMPDVEQLRKEPAYPKQIGDTPLDAYLQLPTLDPRIPELARNVTARATNAFDRARLIEEHLRNSYGYTLDVPFTGSDPLAGFLFTQKRGHCEYFASAMTIMLRTLGIPSRLVNGFLPGQYNDISGMYVVRASEAHSWVEAYFPGYGWMTFDPTPAAGQTSAGAYRLSMWLDALQTFWIDWVINYDFTRQFTLARNLDRSSRRATLQTQRYLRGRYMAMLAAMRGVHRQFLSNPVVTRLLVAMVVLGFLLVAGWRPLLVSLRAASSQARSRTGRATVRDASLAYQRLLDLLARRGFSKAPAMSPREFLVRVDDTRLAPLVSDFTGVYEAARFGGSTELIPRLYGLLAEVQQAARPNHH
jgi:hypothetical protein